MKRAPSCGSSGGSGSTGGSGLGSEVSERHTLRYQCQLVERPSCKGNQETLSCKCNAPLEVRHSVLPCSVRAA